MIFTEKNIGIKRKFRFLVYSLLDYLRKTQSSHNDFNLFSRQNKKNVGKNVKLGIQETDYLNFLNIFNLSFLVIQKACSWPMHY